MNSGFRILSELKARLVDREWLYSLYKLFRRTKEKN